MGKTGYIIYHSHCFFNKQRAQNVKLWQLCTYVQGVNCRGKTKNQPFKNKRLVNDYCKLTNNQICLYHLQNQRKLEFAANFINKSNHQNGNGLFYRLKTNLLVVLLLYKVNIHLLFLCFGIFTISRTFSSFISV